jgi:hypothetical protein
MKKKILRLSTNFLIGVVDHQTNAVLMVCTAVGHTVMNFRIPWASGELLELLSKYLIVMKGFPVLV